ncbi:MAG: DUF115 domain-containing protein [Methanobacteriota archaeon]|nr:MAG: DUF115 domain-containing protein [Euryarchaeota archaeon]
MLYNEWKDYYHLILKDFGFDRGRDETSARLLSDLLRGEATSPEELEGLFKGKTVTVAGDGPNLPRELDDVRGVLIAADEATSVLLENGMTPNVVMTDLDGKMEDLVKANEMGAIVIIHAHGDNQDMIKKFAGRFRGRVMGTTQSVPFDQIHNFGGFTDGDRGVFLADHFEASEIRLVGFDFDNPREKGKDIEIKKRKLNWAFVLVSKLPSEKIILH